MNYAMLDTYMNFFLLASLIGGILYGIYYLFRKRPPTTRETPKRPAEFKPRVKQEESEDEEFHSRPPITDWKEFPVKRSMHDAIAKPPSFRPVKAPKVHKGNE